MNKKLAPRLVVGSLLLVATLLSVGCGKNHDSNEANQVVATLPPPAASCMNPSGWPANGWNQYQQSGFYPYGQYGQNNPYGQYGYGQGYPGNPYGQGQQYPQVYQPQSGFCGCGAGQMPVCDAVRGMGCVNNQYMQNQQYAMWGYNQGQNPWAFRGYGQGYRGYNNHGNNSCYQGVAQTCIVGSAACGQRGVCMATTSHSQLGVCVSY